MMFVTAMIAVAVLGVAAVAVTGSLDRMQPVVRDHVEPAAEIDDALRPRFSIRLRGYDMAEVDEYLIRVRADLADTRGVVGHNDADHAE